MTTEHDPRTRIVLSWLREDAHENAERMLLRALDEVEATPQRRSWWPAWRSDPMKTYAKLIVGAAAVLVVVVVGYQFLPGSAGPGGPAPSPIPTLLARGTFGSHGGTIELDATGGGNSVTGVMTVTEPEGPHFTVDLQCARTTPGGLVMIAGDVTDSTHSYAPNGSGVGIIMHRGSPVAASMHFEHPDPPAATCLAFLPVDLAAADQGGLEPIDGTVELAP